MQYWEDLKRAPTLELGQEIWFKPFMQKNMFSKNGHNFAFEDAAEVPPTSQAYTFILHHIQKTCLNLYSATGGSRIFFWEPIPRSGMDRKGMARLDEWRLVCRGGLSH